MVDAYLGEARSAGDSVRTEAQTVIEPYAVIARERADNTRRG